MKYEMTKDLETGNSVIDGEHRELFEAVNSLMDSCSKGQGRQAIDPVARFLLDYVDKHFSHEEELQKKSGYPGFLSHKQFHTEYAKKLRALIGAIPASGPSVTDLANINQHIGVLVTHIRTDDKKLGQFINDK